MQRRTADPALLLVRSVPWLLALAVCWGCSGGGAMPTAPVTGKITYKGQPVTTGTVMFVPEKGPAATGEIGPDGTYRLKTYGNSDGAVLGKHKVAITALEDMRDVSPEQRSGLPKPIVPAKYLSQDESGLRAEIRSGDNVVNFDLKD